MSKAYSLGYVIWPLRGLVQHPGEGASAARFAG
jgi:hypothetical protein